MKTFTFIKFLLIAFVANLMLGSSAFAQITQVAGSPQNATTTGTLLTITKPSGLAVNDVMIANIVQSDNDNATLTDAVLNGWLLVEGTDFASSGTSHWHGTILYKVATASDVSAANFGFTLDSDADEGSVGAIVAFRNVDVTGGVTATGAAGGPFDVEPGTISTSANTDISTVTVTGITTATPNAAVVMLGLLGNNRNFNADWQIATGSQALTELYDVPFNTGLDNGIGAAWAIKSSASATGSGTVTLSGNARNGGILVALKAIPVAPSVTLTPAASPQNILIGQSITFSASAFNYAGTGNYTYTWTAAAGSTNASIPAPNPATVGTATNAKAITFSSEGVYKVYVQIARAGATTLTTDTVLVQVNATPAAPNMWASSSTGSQISSFTVINGIYINGPNNIFAPTFPGTTTGGTTTAAIGRNDQGGIVNGFFYWLPNTSTNNGVVEVFAATATGATPTRVGSFDVNGNSTNSLGFVRLGMGPDGRGWILAGDGSTLYLTSFMSDGVNPVTFTTKPVSLTAGSASTFQNGDVAISGDSFLFALANDGNGVTQIFVGGLNVASVELTPVLSLVDNNNAPFVGSVNGVAFDELGNAYVTTAAGLYFIDGATVNGPAATVQCALVRTVSGLQDLASNFFPSGSPLPLTLIDFKGNYRNENATISWSTENMYSFSHFELERSTDGTNFSAITSIGQKGDGLTKAQYQFIDNLSGVNNKIVYYRLKMIDIDGKFKYSNIIVIRKEQGTSDKMSIYPNPLRIGVNATVSFTSSTSKTVNFNVFDMSGKVVLTQQSKVAQGNNSVTIKSMDNLTAGMYIIRANDGENSMSAKFYIVR
ncbi:MAG: T9SS type A sorting domain-containing protein [Chitinophagaceae bacterium]|nr:T9SS type A sorting domain-containing protein [Chitinophagaceae bacterium]